MPTPEKPVEEADAAQRALRGLAHATRSVRDPGDIYPTLGSLSRAASSMAQSVQQLAAFHDGAGRRSGLVSEDSPQMRSAAY